MGATFVGSNIVSKADEVIGIGIRTPLEGCFNLHTIFLPFDVNDVGMNGCFFAIDVGDIFFEATFILVGFAMGCSGALIGKGNADTGIEVS